MAHNGSVAVAYPIENITIDGNLEDWPEGMTVHAASRADYGEKPESSKDLSCRFRLGFSEAERAVYVAVEVEDDSEVLDPDAGRAWDTQDGCSIYFDQLHKPHVSTPAQYFQCGDVLNVNGANASKDPVEVKWVRTDTHRIYEWRIQIDEGFDVGRSFGFDLDVTDKDEDGSFTWLAWGPGSQKAYYPYRNGDLFLLPQNRTLGSASGRVDWENPNNSGPPPCLSLQSTTNPQLHINAICDPAGQYKTELPAGSYILSPVDRPEVRVDESDHIHIHVSPNREFFAPTLKVSRPEKPDLIKDQGLLHDAPLDRQKVDQFVRAYMDYYRIPGVSLGIVVDSKIAYHQQYGYENAATQKPLREESVFEACSLTKPIFAYAVSRLVERGVLDLDTPLIKYLPGFKGGYEEVLDDDRHKRITARLVLTHRTGFPNWRSGKLKMNFEPGTGYGYSGEGFELLGAVVTHLEKKSLVEIVKDETFKTLGIENSYLIWSEDLASRVGNGHTDGMNPVQKSKTDYPGMAYSLHSNGQNYAKLITGILRREGLSATIYNDMLKRQFEKADPTNEYEFPYGLGLVAEETDFGMRYWHGGVNPGWRCQFAVFDKLKMGYVVFTNNEEGQEFAELLEQFLITGRK